MKTTHKTVARLVALAGLAVGLVGATPLAMADETVEGVYEVRFEEVANNCTNVGMALGRGQLKVEKKKNNISVDIERIPVMNGVPGKNGKLRASSKLGATSIAGLDGKFSVAGAITGGALSLVFVAEYYVKDKSLCTQSWNVSGARK
ncbi:MAG: hypothetical protein KBG15_04095 [Kofleriaceae bacterium]|nr:hypothetical protein [Kofleriaceae bacterium]